MFFFFNFQLTVDSTCHIELKRKATREEEKLEVREIIRDIVSHDKFTCLECSRDSSEMSDIYKPAILRYSFNLPTLREYSSKSLHETVTNFFKHGTACILPQNRGYSRDELHYQFWNLEKSVASIEEAYLWYGIIYLHIFKTLVPEKNKCY